MTNKILEDLRAELARVEPEATALQRQARELAERARAAGENVARIRKAIAALEGKPETVPAESSALTKSGCGHTMRWVSVGPDGYADSGCSTCDAIKEFRAKATSTGNEFS